MSLIPSKVHREAHKELDLHSRPWLTTSSRKTQLADVGSMVSGGQNMSLATPADWRRGEGVTNNDVVRVAF